MSGSLRTKVGQVMPPRWRPHVLDALDERGVVRGTRVLIPEPGACRMADFTEAYPNADEVLVESLFSAVSRGTEGAIFRGETTWCEYPEVPGYSQVGRVLAAGGHSGPQRGELVATTGPHASVVRGSSAEALRIPDGVRPEHAAFHQLAAIAFQAIRRLHLSRPEGVIVVGAGALGYLAAAFASVAGHDVTLVSRSASRMEAAKASGIRTFALLEHPDESGWPTAPVVIDFTGTPEGAVTSAQLAETDGTVVLAGSTRGEIADPPIAAWARKRVTLLGAHVQSIAPEGGEGGWTLLREREAFLGMLAAGTLDLEPLITDTTTPAELDRWYRGDAGDARTVGVLVDWSSTPSPRLEQASRARVVGRASRALTSRPPLTNQPMAPRSDRRTIRYAIVGCGDIGIQNAKAIEASGAGVVALAVDPNLALARSLAAGPGCPVATELVAGLEDADVGAVLISAPHHLHLPLALAAAEAGKHVVIEKPLALDSAEGAKIVEACRRAEVGLTVCYTVAVNENVLRVRQLIKDGVIGRVTSLQAAWAQGRSEEYWAGGFSGRARNDWRSRRETAGGGVLIMNACHFLYAMDMLTGSHVSSASASMGTLMHDVAVEDTIVVGMEYENGVIGGLTASSATNAPPLDELTVTGTAGRIAVLPEVRVEGGSATVARAQPKRHPASERTRFFRAVSDALLDGTEMPVTAESALAVQTTIDRSYEGAAE